MPESLGAPGRSLAITDLVSAVLACALCLLVFLDTFSHGLNGSHPGVPLQPLN